MREEPTYDDSIDVLESIAEKHDLLLSTNLINFAEDVWALAYKQRIQDEALYQANQVKEKANEKANKI